MFGYLFLILGLFSTFVIVSSLGRKIFSSDAVIFAASIPVFFTFHTLGASLLTLAMPTGTAAVLVLILFIVCGIFSYKKIRERGQALWSQQDASIFSKQVWILIAAIFILVSFFIIKGFTLESDGTWSIGGTKAVDTPYHISQVTRIAYTQQWDFEEPNFAGEFIRYSYYINFASGILLKFGLPITQAMHIPTVLLTFSWAVLMAYYLKSLSFRSSSILFICLVTLFGSGLGYIASFASDGAYGPLLRGDAVWPMQNIAYPAMIPGFLIWQRSFILGFPLFLLSLTLLLSGIRSRNHQELFFAGIIAGALPFAHMHSFIALMVIGAVALFVLYREKDQLFFTTLRSFMYPAFLLGVPQVAMLVLLPHFPLPEITTLRLGWMANPLETGGVVVREGTSHVASWLRYMWTNFGPLILLPFAALYFYKKEKQDLYSRIFIFSTLGLWLLPNVIKFQIWDFDNNKLFPYAIFFSLITLGYFMQNKKNALVIFLIIAGITLPSSFMEIGNIFVRYSGGRITILDSVQKEAAAWVMANTSRDATFLPSMTLLDTAPIVQDPIVFASGRRGTSAYKVLVFTHGIDSFERREAIAAFYKDPTQRDILKTIPADYLIADDVLRTNYPEVETKLARAGYRVVFDKAPVRIFQLQP